MEFKPKVSIVIPVYNGSNYMREAIDSALAQTYNNIEIIVVNDGSTDNTEQIAKSYGDKIRYFAKENGGVATALNLGIKNAVGQYISWLSHDDVYYPDKVEKQIKKISKLDEMERLNSILMSNYSLIDEKSEKISDTQFHKIHSLSKLNYPLYPLLNGIVHGCTLLVPRHCFQDIGYFNAKLRTTQDYDLWYRMFPQYKIIFMPELLIKSRWHSEQGSKKINMANREADELWINMVERLTDDQKIEIGDSILSFYQRTHNLVKNAGYSGAERHLSKIIERYENRDRSRIKVSVIIPFYNRITWAIEAIQSVLDQTHTNLEIIIVNDSSTDSIEPIKTIVGKDARIRLIDNNRQRGASGARNSGIDIATGEYISFLDSDDLFLPDKIDKQLEFMVRNGYLFSHTSYYTFSDKGDVALIESVNNLVYPAIIENCFAATPTVMIHRDFLRNKNNRFPEDFAVGEDVCLWIRLSKIVPFKGINAGLTKVRLHGENAAYDKSKQIQGIENILDYTITNFLNKESLVYAYNLNKALEQMKNPTAFFDTPVVDPPIAAGRKTKNPHFFKKMERNFRRNVIYPVKSLLGVREKSPR